MSNINSKVLAVVPARIGSTRIDKKLLRLINGVTIIECVVRQLLKCKTLDKIIVVTDSIEIQNKLSTLSCNTVLSEGDYKCGTDRCASVLSNHTEYNYIINVQGDQPFINPDIIDQLVHLITSEDIIIASLMTQKECNNSASNIVKVSVDSDSFAQKFSRDNQEVTTYQHIGVYAFTRKTLVDISQLPPSDDERKYRLEQLRWMHYGKSIKMLGVDHIPINIDVESDFNIYSSLVLKDSK